MCAIQTCRSCGVEKPLSEFIYRTDTGKYRTSCHDCMLTAHRARAARNIEVRRIRDLSWRKNNAKRYLLQLARQRAAKSGVEFSITENDFEIPQFCPMLPTIELSFEGGMAGRDNSPSLDRINSNRGYIPGNVQIISDRANRLKRDGTWQELMSIALHMKENANGCTSHTTSPVY